MVSHLFYFMHSTSLGTEIFSAVLHSNSTEVFSLTSHSSHLSSECVFGSYHSPLLSEYNSYHSWHNVKTPSLCFILISEVKWPSCTSVSNRWQRHGSLVVLDGDENVEKKLLCLAFVCKYKSAQKREPEIVSELECFHSPGLDMDDIFFLIWGLFTGHLFWERGDLVAVRKWKLQTVAVRKVGWGGVERQGGG